MRQLHRNVGYARANDTNHHDGSWNSACKTVAQSEIVRSWHWAVVHRHWCSQADTDITRLCLISYGEWDTLRSMWFYSSNAITVIPMTRSFHHSFFSATTYPAHRQSRINSWGQYSLLCLSEYKCIRWRDRKIRSRGDDDINDDVCGAIDSIFPMWISAIRHWLIIIDDNFGWEIIKSLIEFVPSVLHRSKCLVKSRKHSKFMISWI